VIESISPRGEKLRGSHPLKILVAGRSSYFNSPQAKFLDEIMTGGQALFVFSIAGRDFNNKFTQRRRRWRLTPYVAAHTFYFFKVYFAPRVCWTLHNNLGSQALAVAHSDAVNKYQPSTAGAFSTLRPLGRPDICLVSLWTSKIIFRFAKITEPSLFSLGLNSLLIFWGKLLCRFALGRCA
jgi:hypothetical protein